MPAPTTNAEFVELVRKSGVVDEKRLDAYMEKLRTAGTMPSSPGQLAGMFVHDGLLTLFQAKQIVELGKWRRFTIGKYKVLEQLGAGGMGSVYLCEHMLMRRRVAVKVLPKTKAEEQSALERFYREARAVAALDHPNIVRAYDIDSADNLHFLVMEFVDGANLQEIVKRSGPMDPIRAAHYIRQAALGLQHAHEQAGMVHRDIKPGNILVDRNGIVKILDMGLARYFHDPVDDDLTKKHDENVLGTADYLAPEQAIDSHGVDIRADIYSLGATFYFCIAGRTPFAEGTVAQKLIWHQTRQPKPLKSIRPDVDDGLAAIIERMMTKDPNQRYQTPLEVVEALSPWTTTSIPPPSEVEMPRLSLAATGNPSAMAPSMVSSSDGLPAASRSSSGTATPGPKPAWQVPTPPNLPSSSPATVRSHTPPARPASPPPAPASRPPSPPALAPVAQSAPAPAPAAPVAAAPRPAAPVVLQAAPARPAPAPVTNPITDQMPIWETGPAAEEDATERPETAPKSTRRRTRESQKKEAARKQMLLIIFAAVGVLLIGVAGFFIWRALSKDDTPPPPPPGVETPKPKTYTIGPSDGNEDPTRFSTIRTLMNTGKLRSGDRIVVQTPEIHDILRLEPRVARGLKNITIEADPNLKEVVWKKPKDLVTATRLVFLEDAEDFTIKGFTFDGEGKVENLIQLACDCHNVKLENLKLRGFTASGIRFTNCMAEKDRPITVSGVEAKTDKPPLLFEVAPSYRNHPHNQYIDVLTNCKFEGNLKVPVLSRVAGDSPNITLPPPLVREDGLVPPPPPPKKD